jgi:hypothetical protein
MTKRPSEVRVKIKSSSIKKLSGNIKLELPAGWQSTPASSPFELTQMGEELTKVFTVMPSKNEINSS